LRLTVSKGPNKVGISLPSPEDESRSSFRNVGSLAFNLQVLIKTTVNKVAWAGHMAQMGEKRNVYRLLIGKPEGKRPLGRQIRRWMDNIKMDLLEIGLSVVDSIGLAHGRYRWRALVNTVMNIRIR
jgi:hypothetical protein